MTETTQKPSNLILQRSVGGKQNEFREVVKDPMNEFKVIGVIRQGNVTERGQQQPIFHLYDMSGKCLASEKDRGFLEEKTTPILQQKLRTIAQEKWREEELSKARHKEEQQKETPEKTTTKRKTKAALER